MREDLNVIIEGAPTAEDLLCNYLIWATAIRRCDRIDTRIVEFETVYSR
jgi:hypothetical protein